MTLLPGSLPCLAAQDDLDGADGFPDVDEIIDLTDRRRVLLHILFGVRVPAAAANAVFERIGAEISRPR